MVDGFPQTREQWTAMTESNVLPDSILSLEESEDNAETLLKRFMAAHGLADSQEAQAAKQDKKREKEVIGSNMLTKTMWLGQYSLAHRRWSQ